MLLTVFRSKFVKVFIFFSFFFVKWVWITYHEHFECSLGIVDDHYFSKCTIYHEYDNSIINAYFAKCI